MTTTVTLWTLLHVLIFVYWLGGDLGAYYTSRFVYASDRPVPARALAAKVLSDVDMAPRTALILAFPTGFALANAKGWIAVHPGFVVLAFVAAGLWVMLAFVLHMDGGGTLASVDLGLRWAFVAALAGVGVAALMGEVGLPRFIALKLLVLAFAAVMGLCIRRMLRPFGPAFGRLMTEGASRETDAALARVIGTARPFVLAIWAALIAAAWLGIATPT